MVEKSEKKSSEILDFLPLSDEKTKILSIFPNFFPFSHSKREEILDIVIKEIQLLLDRFQKDPPNLEFIYKKIIPYVFLNPHYHVSERFLSLLQSKPELLEETQVSKFYQNSSLVSIMDLANYFENGEKSKNLVLPENMNVEEFYNLLNEITNFNNGKISHLDRVLCWFPDYLALSFQTKNSLMISSGPLPIDWRFYLGIMAVSCYSCKYLFNHLSQLFLNSGGDPDWLIKGLSGAPKKIQNLKELNSLLAYRPWALNNSNFIKDLLKGKDQWSIPELMHAMMIFAYYHSWSCFVFANGLKLENDMHFGKKAQKFPKKNSFEEKLSPIGVSDSKNEEIVALLKKIEENNNSENISHMEGVNANERKKIEKLAFSCTSQEYQIEVDTQSKIITTLDPIFNNFISEEKIIIDDFNYHNYSIMRSHDFNLTTHGYALLNEFLPEFANDMQKELEYLFKYTKMTFEKKENVNTEPFRRAIKCYTENIFGYYHDHYEYKQVNLLMPKEFKTFLKNIATKPFEINQFNSNNIKIRLFPSEKCHVSLLTIMSKFQVEVIYSLEGLGRFLYDKQ